MKTFRDLRVWQHAHDLVLQVYRLTQTFPNHELYGLSSQLRRAAVSVPANIVEGFTRKGNKDFSRFLNVAQGSLEETKYFLLLAKDLDYLPSASFDKLQAQADTVGKMLHGLMTKVSAKKPD